MSACRPHVLAALALVACTNNTAPIDGGTADTGVTDAGVDASSDLGRPDLGTDLGPLPDITVDSTFLSGNVQFTRQYFPPSSCELAEGCVMAAGWRTLLSFTTFTPNVGQADLVLGPDLLPDGGVNPIYEYSTCHMHYHFRGYADYTLLHTDGTEAAHGHKQSFCVEDLVQVDATDPTVRTLGFYGNCGELGGQQGISRGWADDYYPNLPCQWIDVTDTPPGSYVLEVAINGMHGIVESDYTNDTARVPVTIPVDFTTADPTRDCTATDPYQGAGRNCGWRREGVHACTPGQSISVGCNRACGVGACNDSQGGYDIRVCAGDLNCDGADATHMLQSDFGECSTGVFNLSSDCGVARFTCPPEGQYTVLVTSDVWCMGDFDCYSGGSCVNGWCVTSSTRTAPFAGCILGTVTDTADGGVPMDAGDLDAGTPSDGGTAG